MVCVQIRITSFARKVFTVRRRQLYRRRQEMSSFFVHKKHASKHEIIAHRCHVILIWLFGSKPNILSSGRPTFPGRLDRFRFDGQRTGIGRRQRARAVEIQPLGQMVRHQSYWLKTVIVPENNKCCVDKHPRTSVALGT